ncbi:MAG: hypothetical protein SchgKO_01420 [Schleiferiaceae bacterium]
MKKLITLILVLSGLASFGQDSLIVNVSNLEIRQDTVEFVINFQGFKNDTVFIANGDLVFDFDQSQFTNPELNVEPMNQLPTRNNNRSSVFKPFIDFGKGFNTEKAIINMYPMTPSNQTFFDDHVYFVDSGNIYSWATVQITGFTGDANLINLQWVTSGSKVENVSKMNNFYTPDASPWPATSTHLTLEDFPGINDKNFNLKVFLEGPYNASTGEMNTDLNTLGLIPLSQPYNVAPWNYAGTESVTAMPNSNVVDWVLIEIREASNANAANPNTVIGTRAGFLLKNGDVADLDGMTPLTYADLELDNSKEQYVVVYHRNHLAIMSADPLTLSGGELNYDFSLGTIFARGNTLGYKCLDKNTTICGMIAGEINQDDIIKYSGSSNDRTEIFNLVSAGVNLTNVSNGYLVEDVNLDGVVKYSGADNDRAIIFNAIEASGDLTKTKTTQVVK